MGEVLGSIPEPYRDNSSATENTGDPASLESRIPLRTETIQKQGYSLEKNYYDLPTGKRVPVEITLVQNGERRDLRLLLGAGNDVTFVEDFGLYNVSLVDIGNKNIYIPASVVMPAENGDHYGIKKTETSLQASIPTPSGQTIEVHDFLSLQGSLLLLAHEAGHIEYDKHISEEEIARRKAVLRRANTPPFDFTQMTAKDAQDYMETVLSSEAGAWVEAIATYHTTKQNYGVDISDGMQPGEIMNEVHNCLGLYARQAEKLQTATQNALESPADRD